MRARIVVPLVLALAALSPGGAAAVPCSPLDCGPSAQAVAGGTTLAVAFGRNKSLSLYDLGRGQLREVLDGGVVERGRLARRVAGGPRDPDRSGLRRTGRSRRCRCPRAGPSPAPPPMGGAWS